jgi:hypothetical protein
VIRAVGVGSRDSRYTLAVENLDTEGMFQRGDADPGKGVICVGCEFEDQLATRTPTSDGFRGIGTMVRN